MREGTGWEILGVRLADSSLKVKAHSIGAVQISASEILIFGSYFSKLAPTYEQVCFSTLDHDKQQLRDHAISSPDDIADGSFTDTVATHQGRLYAFNSYAAFSKTQPKPYHCVPLEAFTA